VKPLWTRANIGEVLPGVVTPLTFSIFKEGLTGAAAALHGERTSGDGSQDLRLIGGRAYLNLRSAVDALSGLPEIRPSVLHEALGFEMEGLEEVRPHPVRAAWRWFRLLKETMVLSSIGGLLVKKVLGMPPRKGTDPKSRRDLLEALEEAVQGAGIAFLLHLRTTRLAISWFGVARRLAKGRGNPLMMGAHSLPQERTRGYSSCMELHEAKDSRDLTRFLRVHGDRPFEEFELLQPSWSDRPDLFRRMISLLGSDADGPGGLDQRPTGGASPNGQRISLPQFLSLSALHRSIHLREQTKYALLLRYRWIREIVRSAADLLTVDGVLKDPGDIFFLEYPDVIGALRGNLPDARERVRRGRLEYERNRSLTPPSLIGGAWIPAERKKPGGRKVLQGIGCSTGIATGKARVLRSISEAESLNPGEIIVSPALDPGWAPFLTLAKGIVTEIGGRLSHVATIAREMGLPAIAKVEGATAAIRTGDSLTVDGANGTVTILENPSESGMEG